MNKNESRGAVLEAVTEALRNSVPRVGDWMPPTIKIESASADTVTLRAFTGLASYRVTIEHEYGG